MEGGKLGLSVKNRYQISKWDIVTPCSPRSRPHAPAWECIPLQLVQDLLPLAVELVFCDQTLVVQRFKPGQAFFDPHILLYCGLDRRLAIDRRRLHCCDHRGGCAWRNGCGHRRRRHGRGSGGDRDLGSTALG